MVLYNGEVVNANADSHPDLFWALKLGGTNFGIITKFDMTAYVSPLIYGAVTAYAETKEVLSEVFADYEKHSHDNDNINVSKSVVRLKVSGLDMVMPVIVNIDGISVPPMSSAEPIQHVDGIGSTHDVVANVVAATLESDARTSWHTFTTKVNTQLFLDIFAIADKLFNPIMRDGLTVFISCQAFQKSCIDAAGNSPVYDTMAAPDEDLTRKYT